jgi:aspartyl-tRNA(Asn)/glutamyl-tRNA(Gln) amidotransferase subunit C
LWQIAQVAAACVRAMGRQPRPPRAGDGNPVVSGTRSTIDFAGRTMVIRCQQGESFLVSNISRDEVAHLARLARLAVTKDELDTFAAQLDVILDSVARVGEVAADDIPPTSHAVPLTNVFRADEPRPGLTQAQALAGAPAAEDGRFRVPRILGEEQ